ncbi:hypothetical protein BDY19DRAFT_943210 [Irpex rosettiformis]|uniref:Uncharacterized protein n=1 Tax=Irpex rosettiformis TaxID=378272 RepID=A0ACB8U5N6_9APHY|nr:hypothetical protein BDY19DRAFT_943210 [Irpex rosettiformis]
MNSVVLVEDPPTTSNQKNLLRGTGNVYRIQITNAEYPNRLVTDINALAGSGNPPIFAVVDLEDDTQVWEYDSFRQTIQNKKSRLYAYPEGKHKGMRIVEGKLAYAWDVEMEDGGLHSIGIPNTRLRWALATSDNWCGVTLQERQFDDDTWKWVFNLV